MKELSIEEKAKAYDEAKLRMSAAYNSNRCTIGFMNEIFPELAESEDERIRKALIDGFTVMKESKNFGKTFSNYHIPIVDILAWLENQSQIKESSISQHENKTCKENSNSLTNEDEKIKELIHNLLTIDTPSSREIFSIYGKSKEDVIAWLEKQGEQKTVVIIPKFRVGDEIKTSNEESLTITKIDEKGYWSEDLFICDFDEERIWDLVGQKPADKVEQKFNVGDKIQYLKGCGTIMTIEKIENGEYIFANNLGHTTIEDGNKWYLVERNHTWSEEDEKIALSIEQVMNCASLLNIVPDKVDKIRTWLKSLKNKVHPKQEWNEEDEDILNTIINHFEIDLECTENDDIIRWLKSLRPQNRWKPSEEQMTQLKRYCPDNRPLTSLYEQLKKLKEK